MVRYPMCLPNIIIVDGNHRVMAKFRAGQKTIPAYVFEPHHHLETMLYNVHRTFFKVHYNLLQIVKYMTYENPSEEIDLPATFFVFFNVTTFLLTSARPAPYFQMKPTFCLFSHFLAGVKIILRNESTAFLLSKVKSLSKDEIVIVQLLYHLILHHRWLGFNFGTCYSSAPATFYKPLYSQHKFSHTLFSGALFLQVFDCQLYQVPP